MKQFPVAMLSKNADPVWDEAEVRPVGMTHGGRKKKFVLMSKYVYDEMMNLFEMMSEAGDKREGKDEAKQTN